MFDCSKGWAMLNMQEAGAIFGCMRCELEGYKDLAIDRMRYGLYFHFLPSGHPQRPQGCQRPNQRTHNSIMRNAEQAKEAGHPVKGVCGPSVFCLLPYFRIGGPGPVSWVLDARMHLCKQIWQGHLLPALLGLRTVARPPPPPVQEEEKEYIVTPRIVAC